MFALRSGRRAAQRSVAALASEINAPTLPFDRATKRNLTDVIIVGAGHNGLVAATLLARQGLTVEVLEEKGTVGGACKTERPFPRAPNLAQSTGAYLLGVMPPELIHLLGVNLPLRRRDPHYFLPTTDNRYLLFGSDAAATKRQFLEFFSQADWDAHCALQAEMEALRDDVAPSWLTTPLSVEETAEAYVRPGLREAFVSLCRGTVRDYLDRFGFKSDLLRAMYATTDGFSGLTGGWDTKGSGHNFLVHNMCRLPGADGTWMVVAGGMGRVTQELARSAREAGAKITTGTAVERVLVDGQQARGVVLADGKELRARTVVVNADPFRLRGLVGSENLPATVNARLDELWRPGTTMKVNLALSGLPQYSCLAQDLGQHRTTTHLLPDEGEVVRKTEEAFADAMAGRLPDFPTMEVYTQTAVDPGLKDANHRHSAALFVQWVPNDIAGSSWEAEKDRYVSHLIGIWERFAPGVAALVDDVFALAPPDVERHFGITGGHIHHVCNTFAFSDRFPHTVPGVEGLYSCSAGTHPGGSVVGCAGLNAASEVVKGLGLQQQWKI